MAVFFLWHFPSRIDLAVRAQALPGDLSTGARTFLEQVSTRYQPAIVRPIALWKYNDMTKYGLIDSQGPERVTII